MRGKALLCLAVLTPLVIAMLGEISSVVAHPTTFLLDPATIKTETGEQLTVTLRVDAVTDMYLWVVTIEWNPTYFDLVGEPAEGECLKCGGSTTFLWGSMTDGKIEGLTCTLLGEIPGVDVPPAPNDMATITFACMHTPSTRTYVSITFARYRNSAGTAYYPATEGTVVLPPAPVGGVWIPVDKFGLLAPYIGLASTILVATAATAIYVKRARRRK